MNKGNIIKLMKKAEVLPKLEYSDNILELRDNVYNTIAAVKRRLSALEELKGEIEFEITLSHLDDEEIQFDIMEY